jgi:V/A-type H+-transporting ATPase subunit I
MIVPMQKVALLVRDRAQDEALKKLREIGVLHLEKRDPSSSALSKAIERKNRAESALVLLQNYKTPGKKSPAQADQNRGELHHPDFAAFDNTAKPSISDLLFDLDMERKTLQDRIAFLEKEMARLKAWGDFSPAALNELSDSWGKIFLYELTPEGLSAIPEDTQYIKLGASKFVAYIAAMGAEVPGASPFALPEKSISGMENEKNEILAKLIGLEEKIEYWACRQPLLAEEMAQIQSEIAFETARAAMEKVSEVPGEFSFSSIIGYAPKEDLGRLRQAASENGWALMADDPGPEDQVPTKLKNNKIVQLLNPLTDFLDIVPGYNEVDISGWFLFFFCIFFGIIFGDAVYGIILLVIALIGMAKTAKTGIPLGLKTLFLLGLSTIAWGVLTCSWLGVDHAHVPQFLKSISLSYISAAKTDGAVVSQNLQILCFSLAFLQLSIARIKGIARTLWSLKVLSEIGALGMLWGMFNVVLFVVVSSQIRSFPLLPASLWLIGGGFAMIFIFGNYEGSVGKSIVGSLKNFITVVLGIANMFSDIMSYIRLWAVGLAGASIAATVNTMVGPMMGNYMIFIAVVLLVFGHGLNLLLNTLSVLVHGVRLNTLEFSGHLGLAWSGTAYKPFAETANK